MLKASPKSSTYVNVDTKTLEITISGERITPMAISLNVKSIADLPPMWEVVYYRYMYGQYYLRQKALPPKERRSASLAPPPPWLVALAGVMWEGILQGAAWDVIKLAVSSAISKLRAAGLTPQDQPPEATTTEIRAGWRELCKPGQKQYEMFLSLKRSAKNLPDRHALAYARAQNAMEFGKIIRSEMDTPAPAKKRAVKKALANKPKSKNKS
jgi:hypothetical protein